LHFQIPGKIEGHFSPVIENFVVSHTEPSDKEFGSIVIFGTFDKIRNCSFENIEARLTKTNDQGKTIKTKINVVFEERDKVRFIGQDNGYGPWRLKVTPSEVQDLEFIAEHSCHPLWKTVTVATLTDNFLGDIKHP
jgi:hypothetical protein